RRLSMEPVPVLPLFRMEASSLDRRAAGNCLIYLSPSSSPRTDPTRANTEASGFKRPVLFYPKLSSPLSPFLLYLLTNFSMDISRLLSTNTSSPLTKKAMAQGD
ncbi:3937_t:CDS:2, partial [Acaulospora colombiana]